MEKIRIHEERDTRKRRGKRKKETESSDDVIGRRVRSRLRFSIFSPVSSSIACVPSPLARPARASQPPLAEAYPPSPALFVSFIVPASLFPILSLLDPQILPSRENEPSDITYRRHTRLCLYTGPRCRYIPVMQMESGPPRQSCRERERRLRLFSSAFLPPPLSYPSSSSFSTSYSCSSSSSTYLILRLLLRSSSLSFSSFLSWLLLSPILYGRQSALL